MLTYSKLRDHPKLQKDLIEEIKGDKINDDEAREKIHQTINDFKNLQNTQQKLEEKEGLLQHSPLEKENIQLLNMMVILN